MGAGAFGAFNTVVEGIRDEYRGWCKFRRATGTWPIWTMFSVLSLPVLFSLGVFALVRALGTARLPIIYTTLIALALALGLLWFALRRLANHADVARAQKISGASAAQRRAFYPLAISYREYRQVPQYPILIVLARASFAFRGNIHLWL